MFLYKRLSMNDFKIVKKIFNLAYYDITQNITHWVYITGVHTIFLCLIFLGISFLMSVFDTMYLAVLPYLFSNYLDLACRCVFSVFEIGLVLVLLLFPVIITQNCLDLAFDCKMRGIFFSGITLSYFYAIVCFYGIIFIGYNLLDLVIEYYSLFIATSHFFIEKFLVSSFLYIFAFSFLYAMQYMYIVSMHLLEYKKSLYDSVAQVYQVTKHAFALLGYMLLLQIICLVMVIWLCNVFFSLVFLMFMPSIVFLFEVVSTDLVLDFFYSFQSFCYVWMYLLMYTWLSLVTAHVYRQLICPPVENLSCSSCSDCKDPIK